MKKANVFIKPTGKAKGSQTMAAKGDIKGAPASRLKNNVGQKFHSQQFGSSVPQNGKADKVLSPSKEVAMAKVFNAYPNAFGKPNPSKVVANNRSARDMSTPISNKNGKRKLKFIGT